MRTILSIIIPAYKASDTVKRCLNCVYTSVLRAREEGISESIQIIVVDSSPDLDGSLYVPYQQEFSDFVLITPAQQTLPGAARNVGAQQATGVFLGFIDADVFINERWVHEAVTLLQATEGRVIFGGSLQNATPARVMSDLSHLFSYQEFLPLHGSGARRFLPSGNMAISRALFLTLGGFPEREFGAEDVAFCETAGRRGIPLEVRTELCGQVQNRDNFREIAHHFWAYGVSSGRMRRELKISGSWIGWLPPVWPVLPLYRWLRLIVKTLLPIHREKSRKIVLSLLSFPLSIIWSIGFIKGFWSPTEGTK